GAAGRAGRRRRLPARPRLAQGRRPRPAHRALARRPTRWHAGLRRRRRDALLPALPARAGGASRRMIVRTWRGRAAAGRSRLYADHFRRSVLPALGTIEGFLGAALL